MFGIPGGYRALYNLTPFPEVANEYPMWTFDHVVGQMQLLMAALFAFAFLVRMKWYPDEKRSVNLDTDWVYRRFLDGAVRWGHAMFGRLWASIGNVLDAARGRMGTRLFAAWRLSC